MTNNLSRVTAKIFAGNAPLDTIGQFGSALAGTKVNTQDVAQIQALAAYENGWDSAVISNRNYPTLEEFNGAMKVMSYQTKYDLDIGMPEWDANTVYYTNYFCQVDGVFYKSLIDENIGNNPTSSPTTWTETSGIDDQKLEAQKAYLTGNILTDSKGYNELFEMTNASSQTGLDIIKPDNYTVVNNPTITDDGIFTALNQWTYIASPINYTQETINSFSMEADVFNIYNNVNDRYQTIFNTFVTQSNPSVDFEVTRDGTKLILLFKDSSGNILYLSSSIPLASINQWNAIKVEYANETLKVYTNGDLILNTTVDLSTVSFGNTINIGAAPSYGGRAFFGSIDLNSIRLTINNNLIYQPCLKIPYTLSKTGSKIVDASARNRVQDVYNQYGEALYYTLDTTNQNYTIPMGEVYGMITNRAVSSRQLLEMVTSFAPLSDAGLHLADGALLDGDGIYAQCVQRAKTLSTTNPELFTTESDWQASVTQNGKCGKFVYDSTNNTLRLPYIVGLVESTLNASEIGDLVSASIIVPISGYGTSTTIPGKVTQGTLIAGSGQTELSENLESLREVISSPTITSFQVEAIKIYTYIVVGTVTKTSVQVNLDNITTDLNGKADLDLSNVPNSKGILVESYVNGASWYRVYSDGWCEQGGYSSASQTISLLKNYKDTKYSVILTPFSNDPQGVTSGVYNLTTSNFQITGGAGTNTGVGSGFTNYFWQAKGYIN